MHKLKVLALLGVLLLLLSGCGKTLTTPVTTPEVQPETSNPTSPAVTNTASEPATTADSSTKETVDYCTSCHTDKQKLMETAKPAEGAISTTTGTQLVGQTTQMEEWQKVLVDGEKFPTSIHGLNGCVDCHGGVESPDKDTAHQGVIPNPSKDPQALCGKCHPDIVANSQHSLHLNQTGFLRAVDARSLPSTHPALEQALANNCSNCHVTCGECHVSQPNISGGGFVSGHMFNRFPSMTQNCAICHESRAGGEYLGKNEGLAADVHYEKGQMECVDCHTGFEFHGQPTQCTECHKGPESASLKPPDHQYGGVQAPRCESCHANVSAGEDNVLMHQMHGSNLSCQVCHSIAYNSCEGCHVSVDAKTKQPVNELTSIYTAFLIGRNPIQSYERPYRFVPLRHIPVTRDTFSFYGTNLLPNFDQVETWTYATPHNIQLRTPQTESCNACHGNPAMFLTADKVAPDEIKANEDVIVEQLPPLIGSGVPIP